MNKWVRSGLILMATLALLTQGHNQLFPPTTAGRIPDGVIENRKATKDDVELNLQRKITREVWEDVCEYACGEPDMSDFSIPYLLEKMEREDG